MVNQGEGASEIYAVGASSEQQTDELITANAPSANETRDEHALGGQPMCLLVRQLTIDHV
jgi:hypothetical protein